MKNSVFTKQAILELNINKCIYTLENEGFKCEDLSKEELLRLLIKMFSKYGLKILI